MKPFSLPPDLLEATLDLNDPMRRYAALVVCWGLNPLDVSCRDLLLPGGKNALPVPEGKDREVMLSHQHRWEEQIKTSRMAAAANYSLEHN